MKIQLTLLLPSAWLFLLSACSDSDCQFPDSTGSVAPDWICQQTDSNYQYTALGFADKSSAGIRYMKQMALADARRKLIKQIHPAAMQEPDSLSSLASSKLLHSATSPAGNLYVLVGANSQ